ncbi:hypothetical protein CFP56_029317 [Quercus suber]|uniref:Uncharacterized protein n=1 Tax=Quercus suber TaxID=58331 RepID=A0AAW0MF20_QUESU
MHDDVSNFGSILLQLSDLLLGKKIWEYIFLTEQDPYTYTEKGGDKGRQFSFPSCTAGAVCRTTLAPVTD